MLGGHAAMLRRAAGRSIPVPERTLLRARQTARACFARSRVHGQGHGRVRGRHVDLCRMSCAWVPSASVALVGPHASMPDDVRLSGR
eukprot:3368030-Prymnesium_polylepis.1